MSVSKSVKIGSVTVSYNPPQEILRGQLASLSSQVDVMVLVDNASRPEFEPFLQELETQFSSTLKVIRLLDNKGVAAGQNAGIEHLRSQECDFCFLFDHDSSVNSSYSNKMVDEFLKIQSYDSKISLLGPTIQDSRSGNKYPIIKRKRKFIIDWVAPELPREAPGKVPYVIASGAMMSRAAGRLSLREDFFMDMIDIEWCSRLRRDGGSIYMTPNVVLEHELGEANSDLLATNVEGMAATSVHYNPLQSYYYARNVLRAKIDLRSSLDFPWIYCFFSAGANAFVNGSHPTTSMWRHIKAFMGGVSDAFAKRSGKCQRSF